MEKTMKGDDDPSSGEAGVGSTGRKRTWSQTRAKPGKEKRRKLRAVKAEVSGTPGVKASGRTPSKPTLGLPGVWSGFGDQTSGLHQEEEMENVLVLDEDDAVVIAEHSEEIVTPGPGRAVSGRPTVKPKKRLSAASRMSRCDEFRFRTYDKLIEGTGGRDEVVFPGYMEFQFKIPHEV